MNKDGKRKGPQHQPRGINAAARELGIERTEAQRAIAIASLSSRPWTLITLLINPR